MTKGVAVVVVSAMRTLDQSVVGLAGWLTIHDVLKSQRWGNTRHVQREVVQWDV